MNGSHCTKNTFNSSHMQAIWKHRKGRTKHCCLQASELLSLPTQALFLTAVVWVSLSDDTYLQLESGTKYLWQLVTLWPAPPSLFGKAAKFCDYPFILQETNGVSSKTSYFSLQWIVFPGYTELDQREGWLRARGILAMHGLSLRTTKG